MFVDVNYVRLVLMEKNQRAFQETDKKISRRMSQDIISERKIK